MRKLITIILVLVASVAFSQTTYQLNYDSIRVGKTAGNGATSLYGKTYLKNATEGTPSDSVLTVRNGRVYKIAGSAISSVGFLTYVFSRTASDISGYEQMPALTSYTIGAADTATVSATTTPAIIQEFATNTGFPNTTLIPSGVFNVSYQVQKNSGSQSFYTYAVIYKRNLAGTETAIATTNNSSSVSANTVQSVSVSAVSPTDISVLTTDRIVVKVFAVMVSGTANISIYYDDATDSRLAFPSALVDATNFVPYNGAVKDLVSAFSITGDSIKRVGGTGAQFLMGNGTVQDTTAIQTVSNFFPKGDTRYVKKSGDTMTGDLTVPKILVNGIVDTGTPDASIRIARTLSGGITSGHGFADQTTFQNADAAYAAYDAAFVMSSTNNYDHGVGFQSRFGLQTTGTVTNSYGFYHLPTFTSAIVGTNYGVRIGNPIIVSGATIGTNYGVYVEDLTGANKYAFYSAGTTPSFLGGSITGGSFIKSGGTSAQFLKADGSSDGTSYLPLTAGSGQQLSGELYTNAGIRLTTSQSASTAGQIGYNSSIGTFIYGKAGSSFDFTVYNSAGSTLIYNPTGTSDLNLPSLASSGDVIAGADNSGKLGKITVGPGLSLTAGVLTATGGSSGSVTTAGGTAGKIAKFTSASNIENSILTETGSTLEVAGSLDVQSRTLHTTSTSASAQGQSGYNSSVGFYNYPKAGSVSDYTLYNSAGNTVFSVPTGTVNISALGTITASSFPSPALTGNPTAPTQTQGDNSTKIATTAYVDALGGTILGAQKQIATTYTNISTSGTSEETLFFANIAQSNLSSDGDRIDFNFVGSFGLNANDKYVRISVGGNLIPISGNASNRSVWEFEGYLMRTSSTTYRIFIKSGVDYVYTSTVLDRTVTDFNPLNFQILGQTNNASFPVTVQMGYLQGRKAP